MTADAAIATWLSRSTGRQFDRGDGIEQLLDLAGYLQFASHPAWIRIRLDLN